MTTTNTTKETTLKYYKKGRFITKISSHRIDTNPLSYFLNLKDENEGVRILKK
tara:strand:- start:4297 stop:4455 length:159 start_codon:yes stop_codon:yes gene_type:complete